MSVSRLCDALQVDPSAGKMSLVGLFTSLRFPSFPTPVRRLLWSWTLTIGGPNRVRRSGTFFLTTIAGQGAEIQHPPAFLTTNATYGPIDENGKSRVTLAYDHRLMDGRLVADALSGIEDALSGPIVAELDSITAHQIERAA